MSERSATAPRRALIMAGGGTKVAFQAGVLQVWLDEANLSFDLADGCSGGCLNLAMYCQGMSGTEMADNWRRFQPLQTIDFNWREYLKLFYAGSLFKLDRFRRNIFAEWGLDFDQIRASKEEATFNAYNFSKHELAVWTPDQMTEDRLASCIALPMWFPPEQIEGDTHIDSVFITDANLEEAIERGADELWVIWTVSQQDKWRNGFVHQYFQIIETSANGHFRRMLHRIERNNAAVAAGEPGEFGRHIEVKLLEAEVQMHYLVNFSQNRVTAAVNAGVQAGCEWCRREGIELNSTQSPASEDMQENHTALRFTEEMKGFVAPGETNYDRGYTQGKESVGDLMVRLTIDIDGVHQFVTHPDHAANVFGYVEGAVIGGRADVTEGLFNLFVDDGDPQHKFMRYRLFFRDADGSPVTLSGFKDIKNEPGFDLWADTTTLFTRLLRGHVAPDDEEEAEVLASGIIRIHVADFLRQLTTFRVEGRTLSDRTAALTQFVGFFLRSVWDVYGRK